MKQIIKKGDKFGRLTAVRFDHIGKRYKKFWLFKCECGNEKIKNIYDVRCGNTKSCGCLQKEARGKKSITHGMTGTKIYRIWKAMKMRCLNPNYREYNLYGGRGITICPRWINSFENFYKDMKDCPINKSLDRIDNEKGYCKSNCKWSTKTEQANNTRTNHFLIYKNRTQTIAQWSEETGLKYHTLWRRLKIGWSVEKALTFNL